MRTAAPIALLLASAAGEDVSAPAAACLSIFKDTQCTVPANPPDGTGYQEDITLGSCFTDLRQYGYAFNSQIVKQTADSTAFFDFLTYNASGACGAKGHPARGPFGKPDETQRVEKGKCLQGASGRYAVAYKIVDGQGSFPCSSPSPPPPTPACKDIVALAQSVKDLSTLVTAVVAGGLVDTLKGPGPFTVFAPTNEAFAALPKGTLENLLKPENKAQLDDILTYHVLPAKVLSTDLTDGETAKTVEGKSVTVHIYPSGALKINDATVQQADVLACNGVVHVIDAVLLPPSV